MEKSKGRIYSIGWASLRKYCLIPKQLLKTPGTPNLTLRAAGQAHRRTHKKRAGPCRAPFISGYLKGLALLDQSSPAGRLFHFGFFTQVFLESDELLLLQLLGYLGFDFLKSGQLGSADVIHADHVIAEL